MSDSPPRVKLNLDVWGVVLAYTVRKTLRTGLSLVSQDTLHASRRYLMAEILLDFQRMLEYHTLKRDAEEANVLFLLPLQHTRIVHLRIFRISIEEITALSHLVRVSQIQPAELIIDANLHVTGGIWANAYARFVLPMQSAFARVGMLRFASSAVQWDEDMLFWLALYPQTATVTTHPYGIGRSTRCRMRLLPREHIVPLALQSINPLAEAIITQAIDRLKPRPQQPAAGELARYSFPPHRLVVAEDVTERMLHAL